MGGMRGHTGYVRIMYIELETDGGFSDLIELNMNVHLIPWLLLKNLLNQSKLTVITAKPLSISANGSCLMIHTGEPK